MIGTEEQSQTDNEYAAGIANESRAKISAYKNRAAARMGKSIEKPHKGQGEKPGKTTHTDAPAGRP